MSIEVMEQALAALDAAIKKEKQLTHYGSANKMVDGKDTTLFGDDLLNEQEAANLLELKPGTLSIWRSTGRHNLPFVKIGHLVRYRRSDLVTWAQNRTRVASNKQPESKADVVRREWVGLSAADIDALTHRPLPPWVQKLIKDIDALLKERNT